MSAQIIQFPNQSPSESFYLVGLAMEGHHGMTRAQAIVHTKRCLAGEEAIFDPLEIPVADVLDLRSNERRKL